MQTIEAQITALEERLWQAMRTSDVAVLDELISPDLIFTTHTGHVVGKQDDLHIHRSGLLKFETIQASDLKLRVHEHFVVASVCKRLTGNFSGAAFSDTVRFTRIWSLSPSNTWQVVAGHASAVQNSML
jgi:hypothetical protein